MTAAIRVYDNTPDNRLIFDSSRATIPTFFTQKRFRRSDLTPVNIGGNTYGRINVPGLDPAIHFCLSMQATNSDVNASIQQIQYQSNPDIYSGYLMVYWAVYASMSFWEQYYPDFEYFVNILELH